MFLAGVQRKYMVDSKITNSNSEFLTPKVAIRDLDLYFLRFQ